MKDVIQALFPPGVPAIVRWRLTMFAFAVVVLFHMLWVCGWLEAMGLASPFAKADTIDVKIKSAVEPIRQTVEESKTAMTILTHQLTSTLSSAKTSEIRQLATKRCLSSTADKETINREIDIKEDEYFQIKNVYYTIPDCKDLR